MKISIVVGGRFHAFDLARELLHQGHLGRLITTYPRFVTRQWGFPDETVINLALPLLLRQIAKQFGGEPLTMRLQAILHRLFGNYAARYVESSDVVHGWSSFSEPAIRHAKRNGVPAVLERGSAHMLEQCDLLRDEYQRLGLRWAATHPEVVGQELR
ncbi:MAG TPA: hypothetical protein VFU22_26660, partial [Roseiflexaceae bacterium]|nr:hypothetical protein [Roseiflexaceae bacterium]